MNKYYKLIHYNSEENGPLQLKNISGVDAGFSMVATGTPSSTPDLEYSLDGTTWTAYDFTNLPTITVPADGQIYLRGTNTSGFNVNNSNYYSISMGQDYDLIGNLMSLIDYQNMSTLTSVPQYSFAGLFKNSSHIIHSHQSNLGNCTTTGDYACYSMFEGCSNLLTPIELSEMTTLGEAACRKMYQDCTSLLYCVNVSNVTQCAATSFFRSYYGCTTLEEAMYFSYPLTLTSGECFYETFRGCTSLKSAIKHNSINCTGDWWGAYRQLKGLYYGCTSLVEGMDLRSFSTINGDQICNEMYYDCSSIKELWLPPIKVDISNWITNTPTNGVTLYIPYGSTWSDLSVGNSGFKSDWTRKYY